MKALFNPFKILSRSHPQEERLSTDSAFLLPEKLDSVDEEELIKAMCSYGYLAPGAVGSSEPIWRSVYVRVLDEKKADPRDVQWLKNHPEHRGNWLYNSRLDPKFEWQWADNGAGEPLARMLTPFLKYYRNLTRVVILLQVPGVFLRPHRDLIPGTTYNRMLNCYLTDEGPNRLKYWGHSWYRELFPDLNSDLHHRQGYWALKIPLSERYDMTKSSFVFQNGTKLHYTSDRHAYFLNETCFHGADPVNFYRGVIFMDGILNMEVVLAQKKIGPRILV